MADVRFGPAGRPINYSGNAKDAVHYIRAEGLEAYEYQATYGVKISKPVCHGSEKELRR